MQYTSVSPEEAADYIHSSSAHIVSSQKITSDAVIHVLEIDGGKTIVVSTPTASIFISS